MEVLVAKSAGFCFGVKRAVETVYEQIEKELQTAGKTGRRIYTYGPIIHNEEVVRDLSEKGVKVLEGLEELREIHGGVVVIRSHGVPEEVYERIQIQGLECVDATCPFVKRIHNIVKKESEAGKQIVIIGNAGHPEVEGIRGWSRTPAAVVGTAEEALNFTAETGKQICIVSQTTFNNNKFQELVEIFRKRGYDIIVVNTICSATQERQTEARAIAARVDVMIVIGGMNSSNTRKLYEICSAECVHTYFIQTLDDLHLELPKSVRLVGITAGASTPSNIIEEVQNYVRFNF